MARKKKKKPVPRTQEVFSSEKSMENNEKSEIWRSPRGVKEDINEEGQGVGSNVSKCSLSQTPTKTRGKWKRDSGVELLHTARRRVRKSREGYRISRTRCSTAIHSGAGAEAEPVIIIQISLFASTDRASMPKPCGGIAVLPAMMITGLPANGLLFESLAFLT
jgi:hypothetical protein